MFCFKTMAWYSESKACIGIICTIILMLELSSCFPFKLQSKSLPFFSSKILFCYASFSCNPDGQRSTKPLMAYFYQVGMHGKLKSNPWREKHQPEIFVCCFT